MLTLDGRTAAYVTNEADNGTFAHVTNSFADSLLVIDIANRKVAATVTVGKGPNGISVSPSGAEP